MVKHVPMSNNPPVYIESPLLHLKVNAPEFVNKRLLIITYLNMGYSTADIALQLSLKEKYCIEIIHIFKTYGLKALIKRDFGLRQKKEQKKFNEYELNLLKCLVRHTPPKNQKKWTCNILTEIVNHSASFKNQISLDTLRRIMKSKGIDLNAWKHNPLNKNDENFQSISDIVNIFEPIEKKILKDFELDIALTEKIIKNLIEHKKAVTILNVFLKYKQHYNLPKLSIYKFSKLLKNELPNWGAYKQKSNHYNRENKISLSETEKDILIQMSSNTALPKTTRIRAKICLQLHEESSIKKIEEKTGHSRNMIYRVYNSYKEKGVTDLNIKKKRTQKTN